MSGNSNKSQLKSVSHVIFDLDGTLIDTELWGFNNACAVLSTYGKQCSPYTYSKLVGLHPLERSQHLIEEFNIDCDKEKFLKEWFSECVKTAADIQLMPGVNRLIEHLYNHSIPTAIATVGKKTEFYAKSKHLENIFEEEKYFKHIVHGDDHRVKRLKPYPDIYQVCASLFTPTPDPKSVLVFEDNSIGITAAVSAGMQTVLVNDKRFTDIKDSNADIVIDSLEEFRPEIFGLPPFK